MAEDFGAVLQEILDDETAPRWWTTTGLMPRHSLPSLESLIPAVLAAGGTFPDFRLSKAGRAPMALPRCEQVSLLRRPAVDLAGLLAHMRKGWTLVVDGVQQFDPVVGDLSTAVFEAVHTEPLATVYLSANAHEAIGLHVDDHAVVVLQFEGVKRWTVILDGDDRQFQLAPGQIIYLPAGTPHTASAEDGLSGHLTFAVSPPPLSVWLERVARSESAALRSPYGAVGEDPRADLAGTIDRLCAELRNQATTAPEDIARLYHRFTTSRRDKFTELLRAVED